MSGSFYNPSGSFNSTPPQFDLQLLLQLSTSTQDAVIQTVDAVRLIIASVLQLRGIVASQQCELDQLRAEINRLRGLPLPVVTAPFAGFESIGVGNQMAHVPGISVFSVPAPVPALAPWNIISAFSIPTPAPTPPPQLLFPTPGTVPATVTPAYTPNPFFPPPPPPPPPPSPPPPPRPIFSTATPAYTPNPFFPAPVTPTRSTFPSAVNPPSRPKHEPAPAPFLWSAPARTPYNRR